MSDFAILNVDDPPELSQPGTCMGKALAIDLHSIRQLVNSRAAVILQAASTKYGLLALKVVFAPNVREPHDVQREARFMAQVNHTNIGELLNAYFTNAHHVLVLRYYPASLSTLLDDPVFVPSNIMIGFTRRAQKYVRQMCAAIAYIHSCGVAHRDIATSNWMIDQRDNIVLIDFGVAWTVQENTSEGEENLQFELGTGSFRAPELLFGARSYDPFAIDRWSLGVNIAEFFTYVGPEVNAASPPSSNDEYDGHAFATLSWMRPPKSMKRLSLFDGGYSDFTLIGSIFKLLGTPSPDTWPEASNLPDFGKFTFKTFPARDLRDNLVNLPPCETGDADIGPASLISAFLRYPFSARLEASEALKHPWLHHDHSL